MRLSNEYTALLEETVPERRSMALGLGLLASLNFLPDSPDEFFFIADRVSKIDLGNASASDIGFLKSYFAHRNQNLEQMTDNMT